MKKQYRRALAIILVVALVWNLFPNIPQAMAGAHTDYIIDEIEELPHEVMYQQVEFGTEQNELELPDKLEMLVRAADEEEVAEIATPSQTSGKVQEETEEPVQTASPSQADEENAETSDMADGQWKSVKVQWVLDEASSQAPEYDGELPGIYVFDAEPVSSHYIIGDAVLPSIEIEVLEENEEIELAADYIITSWDWVDTWEVLAESEDGEWILALPGVSEDDPAGFEEVTALLPEEITAVVEAAGRKATDSSAEAADQQKEETIPLEGWSCLEYPAAGGYEGSYVFTAELPEGYGLSGEAPVLEVQVELGGAMLLAVSASEAYASVEIDGETEYYKDLKEAWAAAKGKTATVTLLRNTAYGSDSGNSGYTALTVDSGDDITLAMEKGVSLTIESPGYLNPGLNPVYIGVEVNGGRFVLDSGTIRVVPGQVYPGGSYGIKISGGTVEIADGTIFASSTLTVAYSVYMTEGSLSVSGGEMSASFGLSVQGGDVQLSGGTFTNISTPNGTVGDLLESGYIYCDSSGSYISDTSKTSLSGGVTVELCSPHDYTYQDNGDGTHTATCGKCGTVVTENCSHDSSGVCTLCQSQAVATVEIGGKTAYYGNMKTALQAANGNNAVVTLLADTSGKGADITGGTIELRLNGKTWTEASGHVSDPSWLVRGGSVTISGGTLDLTYVKCTGGTVTFNDGTYKEGASIGTINAYLADGGEFIVNGGTFEIRVSVQGDSARLMINDGTFKNVRCISGTMTISGGTFAYLYSYSSGVLKRSLAEGCAYYDASGLYAVGNERELWNMTVKPCTHSYGAWTDNGDGTHSQTCKGCSKVETESHTWGADGVCTGCGIAGTIAARVATADGNTAEYWEIGAAWEAASAGSPAVITLLRNVEAGKTLTVKSGDDITFEGEDYTLSGDVNASNSGLINITGGELTIKNGAIHNGENGTNAIAVNGGALNVEDGSIEADASGSSGVCVYSGTASVTDGTVTGYFGVAAVSSGKVSISGGEINGTNTALYVDVSTGVVLSGGTYSGPSSVRNKKGTMLALLDSDMPAAYYPGTDMSGDMLTEGLDGSELTQTVTVGECRHSYGEWTEEGTATCPACGHVVQAVASVGNNNITDYYTKLEDAVEAANGKTSGTVNITLLADTTSDGVEISPATSGYYNLNLNGKTLNMDSSKGYGFKINGGNVYVGYDRVGGTVMGNEVLFLVSVPEDSSKSSVLKIYDGTYQGNGKSIRALIQNAGETRIKTEVYIYGGVFDGSGCTEATFLHEGGYTYIEGGKFINSEKAGLLFDASTEKAVEGYYRIRLMAGSFDDITVAEDHSLTVKELLWSTKAYFDTDGVIITSGLDGKNIKDVVVDDCTHGYVDVWQDDGNGVSHSHFCAVCGQSSTKVTEEHTWDETGTCTANGCGAVAKENARLTLEKEGYTYDGVLASVWKLAREKSSEGNPAIITLLGDAYVAESLVVGDGDYITLKSETSEDGGEYTISGKLGKQGIIQVNGGSFTLNSGGLSNTLASGSYDDAYGILVNGGSVLLEGGKIGGGEYAYEYGAYIAGGDVEVRDGCTIAVRWGAIYVNGGSLQVNGGTIESYDNYAIGVWENSQACIDGGKISGKSNGAYVGYSGKLEVISGEITGGIYGLRTTGDSSASEPEMTIKGGNIEGGTYGLYCGSGTNKKLFGGVFTGGTSSIYIQDEDYLKQNDLSSMLGSDEYRYYVINADGTKAQIGDGILEWQWKLYASDGYGTVTVMIPGQKPEEEISVSIEWGEMSFVYSKGTWNTETHTYDEGGWQPVNSAGESDENANKITVTNNGNVTVTAGYSFAKNDTLTQVAESGLTGSFWKSADESEVLSPVTLEPEGSLEVWLRLSSEEPKGSLSDQCVGIVTVTIGEVTSGN